ncbi:Integrase [Gammaproteobacteria bacterium]
MPISYTNRKGRTYFLCEGTTKSGKPRYFFSRDLQDTLLEKIPDGYVIQESVNGIVSLAKSQPMLLTSAEISVVTSAIASHPDAKAYRVDVKSKQIIIYERVGSDARRIIVDSLGMQPDGNMLLRIEKQESLYTQFTPIMRFTLVDEAKRFFCAERMRFSGEDHWITISSGKTISVIAPRFIAKLKADDFFDLFDL